MAPRDKNRKLAETIIEAIHDTRYDPISVAHHLVDSNSGVVLEKQIIQTFGNYCEFLAIRYDYGDFTAEEFPLLKQASKIRDIIQGESAGSAV